MGAVRDKIAAIAPWIEPFLDYFDWRKQVVAFVAAVVVAAWSFVKDLAAPVIAVLALATLVHVAYLLVFPSFLRLINVGVKPRPNYSIWRHKLDFTVVQAAYLLADREPGGVSHINGDAAAWYEGLVEAIKKKEITHVRSSYDRQHTTEDGFSPQGWTEIAAEELKKFCASRNRHPDYPNEAAN
jgi:hypothetical protein